MADYSPPKTTEYEPIEPGTYEAYVSNVEEVPNSFYNPETDSKNKKTQFMWTFTIRDGEYGGRTLRYWTGAYFSTHPKSKLTNLVKTTDPEFDIKVCYESDGQFIERNLYRPVRLMTDTVVKQDKEGNDRQYPRILSILPSKTGDLNDKEMEKAVQEYLGLTRLPDSEPF